VCGATNKKKCEEGLFCFVLLDDDERPPGTRTFFFFLFFLRVLRVFEGFFHFLKKKGKKHERKT